MAHPNEETVREGFAAFSAGDMDTLRRIIAPDAIWHVPGRSPISGSYKGIEEVLGFFGRTVALSEGTFAVDVHDIVGNDEHVFAAYAVSGKRAGKSLRDNAVLVFHVRDGRMTEAWATTGDQYGTDEFWS